MSDSLQAHGLQHAGLLYPSLSPRVCLNSCPLSWWCHPTISSSDLIHSVWEPVNTACVHTVHCCIAAATRLPVRFFQLPNNLICLSWDTANIHHDQAARLKADYFYMRLNTRWWCPESKPGKVPMCVVKTTSSYWTFTGNRERRICKKGRIPWDSIKLVPVQKTNTKRCLTWNMERLSSQCSKYNNVVLYPWQSFYLIPGSRSTTTATNRFHKFWIFSLSTSSIWVIQSVRPQLFAHGVFSICGWLGFLWSTHFFIFVAARNHTFSVFGLKVWYVFSHFIVNTESATHYPIHTRRVGQDPESLCSWSRLWPTKPFWIRVVVDRNNSRTLVPNGCASDTLIPPLHMFPSSAPETH